MAGTSKNVAQLALSALLVLGGSSEGAAREERAATAQITYRVKSITRVTDRFGRLDWGANNLIAFDSAGEDGLYDVWTMNPDGTERRCLTCDRPDLVPQGQNGNPAWHPSGELIVFQAEQPDHPGWPNHGASSPGAGYFCNLWVVTADGQRFHQLNQVDVGMAQGSLHPHFSADGRKLVWAERLVNHPPARDDLGEWGIRVADFVMDPEPHLLNVRLYQPGEQHSWYETHGFLADDTTLLFSGNLIEGQGFAGQDVYTYSPVTGELENLTNTLRDWEEHAHLSPGGRKISYMGNTGLGNHWTRSTDFMTWLRTELFLMSPDGSNLEQITHFNEPGFPESTGARTLATDHSWSPDGRRIGVLVDILADRLQEWLYVIDLE